MTALSLNRSIVTDMSIEVLNHNNKEERNRLHYLISLNCPFSHEQSSDTLKLIIFRSNFTRILACSGVSGDPFCAIVMGVRSTSMVSPASTTIPSFRNSSIIVTGKSNGPGSKMMVSSGIAPALAKSLELYELKYLHVELIV